ncbi:tyrosinase family protein [Microlunatus panaciterrae]|uniref:Tyrosinase n=1 Tax=Microlunatus panaciterrae TaxID=400768 RepID=A0ABS2REX7_9ACTN|nr:tyrosinase family protein [Microlunatus panaciterrae]MBM7797563.1 tyrosinase [Microlunatus panaciterrae]
MLTSQLFAGDPLLESIADGGPERISRSQHRHDPAVGKVQTALLVWDPGCLPQFGADSDYGDETAGAVRRFKIEELGVPAGQVIDDVGPQTVIRLDAIQAAAEQPPPAPAGILVRRDVWRLQPTAAAPWDPVILAYAAAVGVLKTNAGPSPHLWWSHQTQVHGMAPDPQDGLRNQCQHNSWFFLPWHRMYIFFFEQICRSIIQGLPDVDSEVKRTWALPYWDYDRNDSNSLPPPFGEPFIEGDQTRPNPLFDAERNNGINSGSTRLSAAVTSAAGWFRATPYAARFPNGASFGGPETGPHHFNESGSASPGPLETTPHGNVHMAVGSTGKMGDFNRAAGDPIFWLHHSNIDRLWEIWRANTGQGLDPTDNRFLNQSFSFLDATGARTTLTPAGVLDTRNQLNYVYENITVPTSAGARQGAAMPFANPQPPQRLGSVDNVVNLVEGQPQAVDFALADFGPLVLDAVEPRRVLLSIEHITADAMPQQTYGVFLEPFGQGEGVLVGSLPLFGLAESNAPDAEHGLSYTFDVTDIVQQMMAGNQWDVGRTWLSLRPVMEVEPQDVLANISIGSISLMVE